MLDVGALDANPSLNSGEVTLKLTAIKQTLIGIALVLSARSADSSEPLRVMTYNVRYASDAQPNAWSDRLVVAKAMLTEQQPDVIGMQEALYRQVKDFATTLPGYAWIGLGREGGSRGEFMAIFYRKDRLDPLEFDHFWLSDTPDIVGSTTWGNSNRRMVTWVRFRDLATSIEFYFMNTHFDHEVPLAREKSAELVLKRSQEFSTLPTLLVGDFNAPAGNGPVYETLVGPEAFADTWSEAENPEDTLGTFHGYREPRRGHRIDWILGRGPMRTIDARIVTFQKDGQYPSDHFPVIASVEFSDAVKE